MITIKLTVEDYRLIRNALETEYHHAKDERNSYIQNRIIALEEKLSKMEENK